MVVQHFPARVMHIFLSFGGKSQLTAINKAGVGLLSSFAECVLTVAVGLPVLCLPESR